MQRQKKNKRNKSTKFYLSFEKLPENEIKTEVSSMICSNFYTHLLLWVQFCAIKEDSNVYYNISCSK